MSRKKKCLLILAGVFAFFIAIGVLAEISDSSQPAPTPTPQPTATPRPTPTPKPEPTATPTLEAGISTTGSSGYDFHNLACTSFDILIDEIVSGVSWAPVTDEEFIERLRDDVLWAVEGTDEPLLPFVQELIAALEAGDLDRVSEASQAVHEECGLVWRG